MTDEDTTDRATIAIHEVVTPSGQIVTGTLK